MFLKYLFAFFVSGSALAQSSCPIYFPGDDKQILEDCQGRLYYYGKSESLFDRQQIAFDPTRGGDLFSPSGKQLRRGGYRQLVTTDGATVVEPNQHMVYYNNGQLLFSHEKKVFYPDGKLLREKKHQGMYMYIEGNPKPYHRPGSITQWIQLGEGLRLRARVKKDQTDYRLDVPLGGPGKTMVEFNLSNKMDYDECYLDRILRNPQLITE